MLTEKRLKISDYFDATESSKPEEIAGDPQGCSKDHDDSETIAKASTKHALGYRSEWQVEFPWMVPTETQGRVTGIMCHLCKLHRTKNKFNQSHIWSETPCVYLRKDLVKIKLMSPLIKVGAVLHLFFGENPVEVR